MAWSTTRAKSISVVGISVVIAALDWFYMFYITSYNFEVKTQNFEFGGLTFAVPIQWLPVLGVFLVTLVAWYEVSARIFPRRAGPETDPVAGARLMRAFAFSVMAFVCVLYVPYLLGSVWFWAKLSKLGRSIPQVLGMGRSLLKTQEPLMTLNPLWQYSISQILATAAMVIVAWAFSRTARRPRKPR
jgi:lysylphosphatidylglycerol synthetase-like protein (DUF2156 family)